MGCRDMRNAAVSYANVNYACEHLRLLLREPSARVGVMRADEIEQWKCVSRQA